MLCGVMLASRGVLLRFVSAQLVFHTKGGRARSLSLAALTMYSHRLMALTWQRLTTRFKTSALG